MKNYKLQYTKDIRIKYTYERDQVIDYLQVFTLISCSKYKWQVVPAIGSEIAATVNLRRVCHNEIQRKIEK
jgi:hypothetical protein